MTPVAKRNSTAAVEPVAVTAPTPSTDSTEVVSLVHSRHDSVVVGFNAEKGTTEYSLMSPQKSPSSVLSYSLARAPKVAHPPKVADWRKEFEARVTEIEHYAKGWDGYQADPPGGLAIEYARRFSVALHDAGDIRPLCFNASVMGGVAFTFISEGREVFVEFYNDGTVYAMFSDRTHVELEPRIIPVRPDPGSLRNLVAEILLLSYA